MCIAIIAGRLPTMIFARRCEAPAQLPGPVYEALLARLNKPLEKAFATGYRGAYQALQERLFDAWVTACPLSCPPRIAQADYRQGYVVFLAATATARGAPSANAAAPKSPIRMRCAATVAASTSRSRGTSPTHRTMR